MAVSRIRGRSTVITGTYKHVTPHGSASNNLFINQVGNVVSINGYVSGLAALSTGENTIGQISDVSTPPAIVRTICTIANAAYSNGDQVYCSLDMDGYISITPRAATSAGKTVYLSIAYIAN